MRVLWLVPGLIGVLLMSAGVTVLQSASDTTGSKARRAAQLLAPTESATTTVGRQVSIPVRVLTTGRATLVMVPVKINGRGPFEFILDTGASTSTVDRALVRRLALPRTGQTARVRGVTGASVVPLVRLRSWTVGGQSLAGRNLTVTDMGEPGIFGLLGSDELRRFGRVVIDYQRRRLIEHELLHTRVEWNPDGPVGRATVSNSEGPIVFRSNHVVELARRRYPEWLHTHRKRRGWIEHPQPGVARRKRCG